MRILVCGDRNYNKLNVIERELKKFPSDTIIIHGAASGADTLAGFIGEKLGMKIMESEKGVKGFPAKWKIYGRAAGPIRNKLMIDGGKPDLVLAFHDNLESSRGTKDMVIRAKNAGIKVILIKEGKRYEY